MPYIDKDELRKSANIVDIFRQLFPNSNLERRGNAGELWCLCPFHSEDTPSFSINEPQQICNCLGCGKGGDIFKLVMNANNCDFPEALKYIADHSGYRSGTDIRTTQANTVFPTNTTAKPIPARKKMDLNFLTNECCKSFWDLKTTQKFMHDRKIEDRVIKMMNIGFAKEGYFTGYITFPFYDPTGKNVIFMNGRRFFDEKSTFSEPLGVRVAYNYGQIISKTKENFYKIRFNDGNEVPYHPSDERIKFAVNEIVIVGCKAQDKGSGFDIKTVYPYPRWKNISKADGLPVLYNLPALRKYDTLSLIEGGMDCLTLLNFNIPALGLPGVETFDDTWGEYFLNKNVNMLLDTDEPGEKATENIIPKIEPYAKSIRVFQFAKAKDPNEYITQNGDPRKLIYALKSH